MLRVFFQFVPVTLAVALSSGVANAALPESLRNAMADVVRAGHHGLLDRVYVDAMADAAAMHPSHASKLSAFAGFIGRQAAERIELRDQVLSEARDLVSLAVRADNVAAELQVVRQGLAGSGKNGLATAEGGAELTARHQVWLEKRARVAEQVGELEALHERARTAASHYRESAKRIHEGQHDAQLRAARLLTDFNAALARHQARVAADRKAQTQAVAVFEAWYEAEKLKLGQLQARIDEAHDSWRDARTRSNSYLARANALADQSNASTTPDDSLREQASAALEAYRTKEHEERAARGTLLELQRQGGASLQQTVAERQAREAILAQASASMAKIHADLASELQTQRGRAEDAIAKAQNDVRVELDAAAAKVSAAEAALVERYGTDYRDLHAAVSAWLEHDDGESLRTLRAPTATRARELYALTLSATKDGPSATRSDATLPAQRMLAAKTQQQSIQLRHEDLVRVFRQRVAELRHQQVEFRTLVEQHAAEREAGLRRLLDSAPELSDWASAVMAMAALLETEFRQVSASLREAGAADAVAPARWRRVRDEIRRTSAQFPRLARYVEKGSASLIEQLGAPAQAPASASASAVVAHVANKAIRADELTPFASGPEAVVALAANICTQALTHWSKNNAAEQTWRFLEGRYRLTKRLGFEALD